MTASISPCIDPIVSSVFTNNLYLKCHRCSPQSVLCVAEVAAPWTEDTVRQCLFLYLSLLPLNHQLVHELASVYTEAIADIKRSVLRAIEQPVSLFSPLHTHLLVIIKLQESFSFLNPQLSGLFLGADVCFLATGVSFKARVVPTGFLGLKCVDFCWLQIRGMGMNSPELLLLVENCPKGAETLVTRCLHILTDKGKKTFDTF